MLDGHDPRWMMLFGLLLWCAASGTASFAQTLPLSDAELPVLLARVRENIASNGKLAEQYTCDEFWRNQNFDKNGKATVDESAKYENLFVEGLPYRKKVETNGKPLAGNDAAAEEKRYAKAARERRAMTIEQKRMSLHRTWRSSFPDCCLLTLFENRIVGYEQIGGRDMIVVESVPRPGAEPKNDDEKSALNWKQKSWIDLSDAMFARLDMEKLDDNNHMAKGTRVRIEFDRVIDVPSDNAHVERAVWLQRSSTVQFRFKMLWIDGTGVTEQKWSNYKKFHVDMQLLDDTVKPVSAPI